MRPSGRPPISAATSRDPLQASDRIRDPELSRLIARSSGSKAALYRLLCLIGDTRVKRQQYGQVPPAPPHWPQEGQPPYDQEMQYRAMREHMQSQEMQHRAMRDQMRAQRDADRMRTQHDADRMRGFGVQPPPTPPENPMELFNRIDSDGDGVVTREEFQAFHAEHGPRRAPDAPQGSAPPAQ